MLSQSNNTGRTAEAQVQLSLRERWFRFRESAHETASQNISYLNTSGEFHPLARLGYNLLEVCTRRAVTREKIYSLRSLWPSLR